MIRIILALALIGLSFMTSAAQEESCSKRNDGKEVIACLEAKIAAARTENGSQLPKGAVAFFLLRACPTGWKDVPDAADKYVVAAGSRRRPLAIGGADSIVLSEAQMPSHRHRVVVMTQNHFVANPSQYTAVTLVGTDELSPLNIGNGTIRYTGNSGHSERVDIEPKYFSVLLCEKE